jgi:catechol 2,3-dioxygenase-like lactoylglutathione lyase family enzyme
MILAKPAIDIGLFTNHLDPMQSFWQQQAGVPFSELLPIGQGVRQYRHAIGRSVFKLNHVRDPLPPSPPSGIRHLTIAHATITTPTNLMDPDGNALTLVPMSASTPPLCIHLTVSDLDRHRYFYHHSLGLEEAAPGLFVAGETRLALTQGVVTPDPVQLGAGYRYMTLQIFDVVSAHQHVLATGGREGSAPRKLGDVAHISFVRDPDGNWIELSQRKSIVGSLD